MSGTFGGREQRGVIPQPVGVVDPGRDFGQAGQLLNRQSREVAGVLEQTGETARRALEAESKRRGEEQGATEELARGPDGRVKPPEDPDALRVGPFTTAGEQARRAVLASRYGHEFLVEGSGALVRLRGEHRDPEKFVEAARAWRDQTLQTLPAQIRPAVGQQLGVIMGQHYRDLAGERMRQELKSAQEASQAGFSKLGTEVVDRTRAGDSAGAAAATATALGSIDADERAKVITPAEAEERRTRVRFLLPEIARAGREAAGGAAGGARGTPMTGARAARQDAIYDAAVAVGFSPAAAAAIAGNATRESDAMAKPVGDGGSSGGIIHWNGPRRAAFAAAHGGTQPENAPLPEQLRWLKRETENEEKGNSGFAGESDPAAAARRMSKEFVRPLTSRSQGERDAEAEARAQVAVQIAARRGSGGAPSRAAEAAPGTEIGTPELLRAGDPTAPGWRPEWNNLNLEQREQLARIADGYRTQARQEAAYARAEQQRNAVRDAGELQFQVSQLQAGALRESRPLTGPELAEVERLEGERRRLLAPFGGGDTGNDPAQRAAFQERQAGLQAADQARAWQAGEDRDAVGRLLGPEAAQPFFDSIAHLQPEAQERIMHARRQQLEQETRRLGAEAAARAKFGTALAGGAKVERNAANQALGAEAIGPDPLDPAARARVLAVTAAGALPQEVVSAGSSLLKGGSLEDFKRYAELHAAAMADPTAKNDWQAAQDDNLASAWGGVALQVRGLDPAKPQERAELERIRSEAYRRARGEGPSLEDVRASLGADEKTRAKVVDEMIGTHSGGVSSAPVPAALRGEYRAAVEERMRNGADRELAAEQAWQKMRRNGWGVSKLGVNDNLPGQPLIREGGWMAARPGEAVVGNDAVPGFEAPRPDERWVRFSPERYPAKWGSDGALGTGWMEARMRAAAKAAAIPGMDPERMLPGRDLVLQPNIVAGEERGYHVLARDRSNIWHRLPGEGGRPLVLDLRTEAAARSKEWDDTTGRKRLAEEAAREPARQAGRAAQESAVGYVGAYGGGLGLRRPDGRQAQR